MIPMATSEINGWYDNKLVFKQLCTKADLDLLIGGIFYFMKKPSPYLTFAGTIPFIVCAVFITLGIEAVRVLGDTEDILSVYGLVIASFMAGAQWGNHLTLDNNNPWAIRLPILSNIVAILLWLGFLSLSVVGFIWLLIIGFLSLLAIDYGLHLADIINTKYFKVRVYVTLIVILSLLAVAVQMPLY